MGGCDGPSRNGTTGEFVQKLPKDTVILTLACGKYRFNDLDLGDIEGIPRLIDAGQCNDAIVALEVAQALSRAFRSRRKRSAIDPGRQLDGTESCSRTLVSLGFRHKRHLSGADCAGWVNENMLKILVDKYDIRLISTPDEDIKKMLG